MSRTVKAVSFDLWDTIVIDDSDEAKRKAQGLLPKSKARRELIWEALNEQSPTPFERVDLAYGVAEAAFNNVWKEHAITWTVAERLDVVLKGLGCDVADPVKAAVIEDLSRMEVDIPPDPLPHIGEALQALSANYKLCIVSDAIVTPGSGLRQLLDNHGLKDYFSAFAFSDEVGHSKPHRDMFDHVAAQMGIELGEIVHIGDRDHNDVKGPQALGMKAVLFTAARDVDKDHTSADAICTSHADLPAIIDGLAG